MSKYTTEVRYICESLSGLGDSKGYADVDTIITNAIPKIFNFSFPIFDETYRVVLEKKILKHFYTREIGEETVGLWKLRLDTKLNEIMPFYNKLYKSELFDFDPMATTDLRTERLTNSEVGRKTGENIYDTNLTNNTTHSDNSGTNKVVNRGLTDSGATHDGITRDLYSDTPQGSLSGVDEETYLTNARKVTDSYADNGHTHNLDVGDGTNTSTSDVTNSGNSVRGMERSMDENVNTTDKYIDHTFGVNGYVPSELLKKYRESLINIDLMIIEELEPLFMQLW